LIPIVTTAETVDARELAQTYIRRWRVQENIIRDFLLPLGLDTNHGFAKTPVENSEVTKKRTALEKRLSNIEQWVIKAKERSHQAGRLYDRLWKQTKAYGVKAGEITSRLRNGRPEKRTPKNEQQLVVGDQTPTWER